MAGGGLIGPRLLSDSAVSSLVDAAWVRHCVVDTQAQDWTVMVTHDLPTGGMAYPPARLDRVEAVGARIVQDFPDACPPIRRGVAQGDPSPIVRRNDRFGATARKAC